MNNKKKNVKGETTPTSFKIKQEEKKRKLKEYNKKPKKPIPPNISDEVTYPTYWGGKNWLGEPVRSPNPKFNEDYETYQRDYMKYEEDLEEWSQMKLIRLIKNANPKLILRKYKIIKKKD